MTSVTKKILVGFAAVLAIVIPAVWSRLEAFFIPHGSILNIRFFILAIVLVGLAMFFIMYSILENEKTKTQSLVTDLENTRRELHDQRRLAYLDPVTGIPNQFMFEDDFERYRKSVSKQHPIHVILIDLDNFSSINNQYGYSKGNSLIRFIAQEIFVSMRRDEEMYKRKSTADTGKLRYLINKSYRMHRGGDEFIFVINGSMEDALGFLVRLKSKCELMSQKVTTVLGLTEQTHDLFKIRFHGAIVALLKEHRIEVLQDWLEKCFIEAKEHLFGSTVSWYQRQPDETYLEEDPKSRYSAAITAFRHN